MIDRCTQVNRQKADPILKQPLPETKTQKAEKHPQPGNGRHRYRAPPLRSDAGAAGVGHLRVSVSSTWRPHDQLLQKVRDPSCLQEVRSCRSSTAGDWRLFVLPSLHMSSESPRADFFAILSVFIAFCAGTFLFKEPASGVLHCYPKERLEGPLGGPEATVNYRLCCHSFPVPMRCRCHP